MRDDIVELKAYGDNSRMLNPKKNSLRSYKSTLKRQLKQTQDPERRKNLQARIDELTKKIDAIPTVRVRDVFGPFDRSIFKR